MKRFGVAAVILGAGLLILAVVLAPRGDPARQERARSETALEQDVSRSAVMPVPGSPGETPPPAEEEGKSSLRGELVHDDPVTRDSASLWLVGPYGKPGEETSRVPLPVREGRFGQSGLFPGEYAIEGDCKGRSLKRSFIILRNGEHKTVRLDLTTVVPRRMRGRAFLDSKDRPLADEMLRVSMVGSSSHSVTTGPDGSFEFAPESNSWTMARFFRDAPSSPFVEVENTGSRDPLELTFASGKGRTGMLVTAGEEPLPFVDFSLRAEDRPELRYWKTSDERGEFPADDILPGEYRAQATSPSSMEIAVTATVSNAEPPRIVLPIEDYAVIRVSDGEGGPVSRGYFYHVRCTSMDEDLWDIRAGSPTPMGATGSALAAPEESEDVPSGATLLGLPSSGECTVEVLDLAHGWGRATFELPLDPREVPVRLAAPVEIEIAVSDAQGSPVESPVFKYPGFHENAPLLPGGRGRAFFPSMHESIGFDPKALEEAGRFQVKLMPGSTISIEAPGGGRKVCAADDVLKERAVVLE